MKTALLWAIAYLIGYASEFAGDVIAVRWQKHVRRLQRKPARRWSMVLVVLGAMDWGSAHEGMPIIPLIAGMMHGARDGTDWQVRQDTIAERIRRKEKAERRAQRRAASHDGGVRAGE